MLDEIFDELPDEEADEAADLAHRSQLELLEYIYMHLKDVYSQPKWMHEQAPPIMYALEHKLHNNCEIPRITREVFEEARRVFERKYGYLPTRAKVPRCFAFSFLGNAAEWGVLYTDFRELPVEICGCEVEWINEWPPEYPVVFLGPKKE